jgi:hypothetical protein
MKPAARISFPLLVALLLTPMTSRAHKPSDSYLSLDIRGAKVTGRWDIALRDLDYLLDLDRDSSGTITWGEVSARKAEIEDYALSRLRLDSDGATCLIQRGRLEAVRHSDGGYAVVLFAAGCPSAPGRLGIDYQLLFERDPQHRGLAQIADAHGAHALIFSAGERRRQVEIGRSESGKQFFHIVGEGMRHIWNGWDHLLFLIALLLPSVLRRDAGGWQALPRWRPALRDVLKIVTAFTVAHSVTLSAATLDVVRLPSRFVEAGIAASVVVAALNNIYPLLRQDRWMAALALGLLHGFGFSATLVDLGLPKQSLLPTLFGFNLGVEIGQLAIVSALFPLAYLARNWTAYRRLVLVGGSIATAAVAGVWFVQRALSISLVPG